MLKIRAFENLVHELSQLPGIGPKSAQRLAYNLLRKPKSFTDKLTQALTEVKEKIGFCTCCFNFAEKEICHICENPLRDKTSICVVEEPSDIWNIESSGVFQGIYHVLHGAISPLEGVEPDDLKINELIQKISQSEQTEFAIKEVIFALDSDIEGDTTSLYISKILENRNLRLTRLAHGVPLGSDIGYIDERTIGRALENRIQL